jgi:hypothetical protein
MNRICLLLVLLLLNSCAARVPHLLDMADGTPIPDALKTQIRTNCEAQFIEGNWQFVHSISFEMASGAGASVLGVTVLDGGILKTALMTMEGFVLFEAVRDAKKKLKVMRALPPFDNTEFAQRLMVDVEDIFPRPAPGDPLLFESASRELICRYVRPAGEVLDIAATANHGFTRYIYDADGLEQKRITAGEFYPVTGAQIPRNIELRVLGIRGYSLIMTLLSAEKIP